MGKVRFRQWRVAEKTGWPWIAFRAATLCSGTDAMQKTFAGRWPENWADYLVARTRKAETVHARQKAI
jgi:hypothetical protein